MWSWIGSAIELASGTLSGFRKERRPGATDGGGAESAALWRGYESSDSISESAVGGPESSTSRAPELSGSPRFMASNTFDICVPSVYSPAVRRGLAEHPHARQSPARGPLETDLACSLRSPRPPSWQAVPVNRRAPPAVMTVTRWPGVPSQGSSACRGPIAGMHNCRRGPGLQGVARVAATVSAPQPFEVVFRRVNRLKNSTSAAIVFG